MNYIILFSLFIFISACATSTKSVKINSGHYEESVDIYSSNNKKKTNTNVVFILLHGKGGKKRHHSGITTVASELSQAGYTVYVPDMPYAPYTETLNNTFKRIDSLVKTASAGNKKVIIGGHSMGAAVAYLYCAAYKCEKSVVGVIMAAPGHMLQMSIKIQEATAVNVQRARKLVKKGKGNITNTFTDYNQGNKSNINAKANVYLSYFDPIQFPNPATHFDSMKVPVLWIDGDNDRAAARMGYENLFNQIQKHSKFKENKYLEVSGGHIGMMDYVSKPILNWVKIFQK